MFSAVAPVSGSRRASGFLGARRAHVASVHARCVLPMAVNPALSAFAWSSGASCWTQRGSCARRGCGLALPDLSGMRTYGSASAPVARRCLRVRNRARSNGGSSRDAFAVEHGPNPAVNRTRRYMASTWRAPIRRAGYLTRWASPGSPRQ
jgi:hypothetical protein